MVFRIKISGILTKGGALISSSLGADAIGLLVGNEIKIQKRIIDLERAREIINALPPSVLPVIKTVSRDINETLKVCKYLQPPAVQVIPDVKAEKIEEFRKSFRRMIIIKVIPVVGESSIKLAKEYERYVDAILLDTKGEKRVGGTGKVHDWNISAKIVESCSKPVILAGGLTPENVEKAIRKVKPYGVDAESCFEKAPGEKDFSKIKRFIINARKALSRYSSPRLKLENWEAP